MNLNNFKVFFLTAIALILVISPCIASENEYKKWWNPLTGIKIKERTYENSKKRNRFLEEKVNPTQFILKKSFTDSNTTPALNKRFKAFDKKRRDYIFVKHTDVFPKWGRSATLDNLIYSKAMEIKRREFDKNKRSSQRPFIIKTQQKKINFYDNEKKNKSVIPNNFTLKKKLQKLTRHNRLKAKTTPISRNGGWVHKKHVPQKILKKSPHKITTNHTTRHRIIRFLVIDQ